KEAAERMPSLHSRTSKSRSFKSRTVPIALTVLSLFFIPAARSQDKSTAPISAMIDVRPEHLLAVPTAENWPSYNGDYTGRRFTALSEINAGNVAQLRAQWVFHVRDSTGRATTP